jgi:hypothetical protein
MILRKPGHSLAILGCFAALTAAGCSDHPADSVVGTWGQTMGDTDTDGGTSVTMHFLPNGTMTEDIVSIKGDLHMDLTYKAKNGKLEETIVGGSKGGHPLKNVKTQTKTFQYALGDNQLLIADPAQKQTLTLKRLSDH